MITNKKNKVPGNQPNQGGKRPVLRKLHNIEEIEEDTNKWKMYHAHGLDELTSSKWPYYPKQFIDSMQSLLEYP